MLRKGGEVKRKERKRKGSLLCRIMRATTSEFAEQEEVDFAQHVLDEAMLTLGLRHEKVLREVRNMEDRC